VCIHIYEFLEKPLLYRLTSTDTSSMSAATITILGSGIWQMPVRILEGNGLVRYAVLFPFEIDRQIAIQQRARHGLHRM
jgi:hypothetical protein